MRKYDLTVLIDVEKGEEFAKEYSSKLDSIITSSGGKIFTLDFEGRLDLAHTFKKHNQAYKTRIIFESNNDGITNLEREFKINEAVIRTLNVLLSSTKEESEIEKIIA